ncbi:MAG: hypothetical protein M3Q76_11295 [Acidobacteriota bacterium]|nr:hypothetical protein [Acidobacteriota bacterium]
MNGRHHQQQPRPGFFRKKMICPSTASLLAYTDDALAGLALRRVRLHLAQCDFCRAEADLLSRHPPQPDECSAPAIMPLAMRLFAQQRLRDLRRTRRAA